MCFHYQNGELYAEGVGVAALARRVGTPFYCYSTDKLTRNFNAYQQALSDLNATVCYSVKANPNLSLVSAVARLGGGAGLLCFLMSKPLRFPGRGQQLRRQAQVLLRIPGQLRRLLAAERTPYLGG